MYRIVLMAVLGKILQRISSQEREGEARLRSNVYAGNVKTREVVTEGAATAPAKKV